MEEVKKEVEKFAKEVIDILVADYNIDNDDLFDLIYESFEKAFKFGYNVGFAIREK